MSDKKLTLRENIHGMRMVAKTYAKFKKLAEEQIKEDPDLTEADYNDVVIGLLVTKLLVVEGELDEKYWRSAIS